MTSDNDDSATAPHTGKSLPSGSRSKRRFDLVDLISMGSRKKSKSKETKQDDSSTTTATTSANATDSEFSNSVPKPRYESPRNTNMTNTEVVPTSPIDAPTGNTNAKAVPQEARGSGWYGSWKQKSGAAAEVQRESVSAKSSPGPNGSGIPRAVSIRGVSDVGSPSPKRYLSGSSVSAKGIPLAASTTNLSITSKNQPESVPPKPSTSGPVLKDSDPPLPPDPSIQNDIPKSDIKSFPRSDAGTSPSRGWFGGWWSRPDGYEESNALKPTEEEMVKEATSTPLPAATPVDELSGQPKMVLAETIDNVPSTNQAQTKDEAPRKSPEESRSWFWRWSTRQNSHTMSPDEGQIKKPVESQLSADSAKPQNQQLAAVAPEASTSSSREGSIREGKDGAKRKAPGWAFWSRESNEQIGEGEAVHKNIGQLAVADTPSQSQPEAAQFNEVEDQEAASKEPSKSAAKRTRGKKQPKQNAEAGPENPTTIPQKPTTPQLAATQDITTKQTRLDKPKRDLLLPKFTNTYSLVQQPSLWKTVRRYFLGGEQHHPHLHITNNPPRIRKALAIGVHGFFPAAFMQKLLGPPTGTSIRFANMAASAIKTWTEARGYECEIEKVALEGEGRIADRIDTLWKLLLNWIDHVRSADLILIACHSQGVPVSIMLAERLIKFGCVGNAKVAINCMAGVNLGPFAEFKTQLFGRSALELFDFSNPMSTVSKGYLQALEVVLNHGVKIVYTGSIDDQLVSLESSTFSNISHPSIYRAVFIDGRIFTSDFITELVGFALKLRNLGLSDHGLIRELSPALAGSIYGGEGHSRLYDCPDVYLLAVSHALETTPPPADSQLTVRNYEGPPSAKDANPFFLPWAMRGVLEEEKVRRELSDECKRLLELFEQWKPVSKGLKDVKFRLEALKSRL